MNTRIIAVSSLKGGSGKTTTTHNLAVALVEASQRVLLLDVDPQGNLTTSLGVRPTRDMPTLYDAILDFVSGGFTPHLDRSIYTIGPGLDLVPSTIRLTKAESDLQRTYESEKVLTKLLAPVASDYDFVLLDTHPSLGILTLNALAAAQEVIMPLESEFLASESAELFLEHLDGIRNSGLNRALRVTGVLLTQVQERANIHRQAVANAREGLGQRVPVFAVQIKNAVGFTEAQAMGQSILEYDTRSAGAAAYRALAQEVLRAQ